MDIGGVAVIDCGSDTVKAGLSSDSTPRCVFETVIGRPKYAKLPGYTSESIFIGKEAKEKSSVLTLKFPLEPGHGIVADFDDMEFLWRHVFRSELKVYPENTTVILAEHTMTPRYYRERSTQIMFEIFNVPALYVADSSVACLRHTGIHTGAVVQLGHGQALFVPVYSGHSLRDCACRSPVSGDGLTHYIFKLLHEAELIGSSREDVEIARDIKEKLCFVSQDYEIDLRLEKSANFQNKSYQIKDTVITIGKECFMCPEAFFKPSLIGLEMPGIQNILFNAIRRCDKDLTDAMWSNVVVAGGSSQFSGLSERLRKELIALVSQQQATKVAVNIPWDSHMTVWKGCSVLAQQSNFIDTCILRNDYEEYGPNIVQRKCF